MDCGETRLLFGDSGAYGSVTLYVGDNVGKGTGDSVVFMANRMNTTPLKDVG